MIRVVLVLALPVVFIVDVAYLFAWLTILCLDRRGIPSGLR